MCKPNAKLSVFPWRPGDESLSWADVWWLVESRPDFKGFRKETWWRLSIWGGRKAMLKAKAGEPKPGDRPLPERPLLWLTDLQELMWVMPLSALSLLLMNIRIVSLSLTRLPGRLHELRL